jgi:hypothetical protein
MLFLRLSGSLDCVMYKKMRYLVVLTQAILRSFDKKIVVMA